MAGPAPALSPVWTAGMPRFGARIGGFTSRWEANLLLDDVSRRGGLEGITVESATDSGGSYEILIGSFATLDSARRAIEPLLRERYFGGVEFTRLPDRWESGIHRAP